MNIFLEGGKSDIASHVDAFPPAFPEATATAAV